MAERSIWLVREDGKYLADAKRIIGERNAELLQYGKIYSIAEINDVCNGDFWRLGATTIYGDKVYFFQNEIWGFFKTGHRWKCVDIKGGI